MRSHPSDASKEEGVEEESEEKGIEEESEKGIEEESEETDIEEELEQDALLREIEMCMISTDDASSIAARSLRGLITFLTSYYRYLHTWEALFYLVQSREGVCKANLAELMSHVYHWSNGQITRHPVGFDHELSMKMVLLDKTHGLYLEAISRIPTALLRSRLHWALLKAGYCYGPLDPVANILINTICFLQSQHFDALLILLQENANLGAAVYRLKNEGLNPSIPDSHAYKIAASKARHPNPFVLADLSAGSMLVPEALKLAKSVTVLSSGDVQAISKFLLENHSPTIPMGPGLVPRLTRSSISMFKSASCKEFEAHQELIRKMVDAALREHARRQESPGDDYELHTICGVNTKIPKDGGEENILLMQFTGSCLSSVAMTVKVGSRFPGKTSKHMRSGNKIVHPSLGSYHGQSSDFKLMACGKHSVTNKTLVGAALRMSVFVHEDSVYSESSGWERITKQAANMRQELFGPKNGGASASAPEAVM
ncbi:hypothetical protein PR202_ga13986 [Eleusine coracana subsp. coracana]|uniref:PIR2-like helical domain-containing protein n=1 Tax=Eleusine coracana subsp. coracana TaxID=191504 RepID=A0AAV5CG51_ELECO|nr:hypothetical protein PR202_ga13986 [Eleusine coracana subsp. coracana]